MKYKFTKASKESGPFDWKIQDFNKIVRLWKTIFLEFMEDDKKIPMIVYVFLSF